MPVFRVFTLERDTMELLIKLVQESELCAHAEVRHGQEAHLLEYEFPSELNLNGSGAHEVL